MSEPNEVDPKPQNPNPEPNPEPSNNDDILDKFKEIKEGYETKIQDKDKEIAELKKQLEEKETEVDQTVGNLNDEVQARLEQSEAYKELLSTVEELQKEKAETTVDNFIQQGKILPAQRETALKLCLSDNDTFLDLYRDAKPIVETQQKRRSIPTGTAERIANYFKN